MQCMASPCKADFTLFSLILQTEPILGVKLLPQNTPEVSYVTGVPIKFGRLQFWSREAGCHMNYVICGMVYQRQFRPET